LSINADIQALEPGGLVELYEIDSTAMGGDLLRFHPHLTAGSIVFQGVEYSPWPVIGQGFGSSGGATQSTPTLTVSNVDGTISALCILLGDLVGAKVKRKRTLAQYLDGQPTADPTAEMPVELWVIEQKAGEDNLSVEFSLSSVLDFSGRQLPNRQVLASLCNWQYRGIECGYSGMVYFDKNNVQQADPTQDSCGKRLSSCKCRFGASNPLPFGGFPSAGTAGTL
jgi:lambda family phage minor tail protein L